MQALRLHLCRKSRSAMPVTLPKGLCPRKEAHLTHWYNSRTLGQFICSGDPADREPYRSEQRRKVSGA